MSSLVSGPKGIGMRANAFLQLPTSSSDRSTHSSEYSEHPHSLENSLRLSFSSNSAGPSCSDQSLLTPPSPMLSTLPPIISIDRGCYDSPLEWSRDAEPVDYFNFKQRTYFPDTPPPTIRRLHPRPSPLLRSHFSPAITPAEPPSLTRPSSPILSSPFPPTPEEDHFPYLAYESTQSSPKHSPSPRRLQSLPSPLAPKPITLKVHFRSTGDTIKFRIAKHISLADLIRTAAKRVPTGWESLYCANPYAQVEEVESIDAESLGRLAKDDQWRSWLEAMDMAGTTRLILWAL